MPHRPRPSVVPFRQWMCPAARDPEAPRGFCHAVSRPRHALRAGVLRNPTVRADHVSLTVGLSVVGLHQMCKDLLRRVALIQQRQAINPPKWIDEGLAGES